MKIVEKWCRISQIQENKLPFRKYSNNTKKEQGVGLKVFDAPCDFMPVFQRSADPTILVLGKLDGFLDILGVETIALFELVDDIEAGELFRVLLRGVAADLKVEPAHGLAHFL